YALLGAMAALAARLRRRDPGSAAVRSAVDLVRAGGPAYVKFGQFIATANGVLPDEWTDAFAWCRDEVPALPAGVAEREIAHAFGRPTSELFEWFSPEPVAAASIAQVHPARLADGTDVMVKVQRPGLREEFEVSVRAMAALAALADRVKHLRIANVPGAVDLFAQLVLEELDFRLEALNMVAIGLATENADHDYVTIPRPIPGLISRNVLVMEKVPGVRYTDLAGRDGVDGYRLVRLAIQGVLEQTLIYGVFHGDLHAGNVLVDDDGNFSLVDFGISGRVGVKERAALMRLMMAMVQEDTPALVAAVAEFGALPPGIDLEEAAREFDKHAVALREMADKPLDQIDMTTLTDQLNGVVRLLAEARFRTPRDLVLFSKNLLYLNGLASAVAPDVNLLAEIEPVFGYFLQKYPQEMRRIALSMLTLQAKLTTKGTAP
ncbi:MAG: ABC1 kinase family protein, partial [Acidimicrobiales bacterium]